MLPLTPLLPTCLPCALPPPCCRCPGFGNRGMWEILRRSGVDTEVRELLDTARQWYKKKGGVVALQIEQMLKLARWVPASVFTQEIGAHPVPSLRR